MDLSIIFGAALVSVVGGFFPWINTELAVLGAAAVLPPWALPWLVLVCTVGQMGSKCTVYGLVRWAPERLPERFRRLMSKAERYREKKRTLLAMTFSGALVSLPPIYLVTLAAGMVRMPFAAFASAGVVGTAIRYGALAWGVATLSAGA